MTAVSSNGADFVGKDNVGKDEMGPTRFALARLVVLVGHEKPHRDRFRWNLKIIIVLFSSPARFDLIAKVGLRIRA